MTLFGVGFRIEAKADITLGFQDPNWSIEDPDPDAGLTAYISATTANDFPIPSTSAGVGSYSVLKITGKAAENSFSISHTNSSTSSTSHTSKWNGKIFLITQKGATAPQNKYWIAIGDGNPIQYNLPSDPTDPEQIEKKTISNLHATKSFVRTEIYGENDITPGEKQGRFDVFGNKPDIVSTYDADHLSQAIIDNLILSSADFDDSPTNNSSNPNTGTYYSMYAVTLDAIVNTPGTATINFTTKDGNIASGQKLYLLPGEESGSITATKTEGTGSAHIFSGFTQPTIADNFNTDYSGPTATFNMKTGADAAPGTLTANYSAVTENAITVSEGKRVYLSNFLGSDPKVSVITNLGESYISVTSTVTTGTNASSVVISGNREGSTQIKVNGDTYNVTVLPRPTLDVIGDSSSSSGAIPLDDDSNSGSKALTFTVPSEVRYDENNTTTGIQKSNDITAARIYFEGNKSPIPGYVDKSVDSSKNGSLTIKELTKVLGEVCDDSCSVKIYTKPKDKNNKVYEVQSEPRTIKVHKIKLDRSGGANYSVKQGSTEIIKTTDSTEVFYAIEGLTYSIKSTAKNSSEKFQKWENDPSTDWTTADGGEFSGNKSRTFKAIYGVTNTSSSGPSSTSTSSSGRQTAVNGDSSGDDYDDVPKTGESKADIWILWSVLLISILGAGFMIRKRFGLVRAIAAADEEMAKAVHDEKVEAEKKEKESKMQMLKDLRKL